MDSTPLFFIPNLDSNDYEARFAAFAGLARRPVPSASERVYSIVFVHNGEEWTATVGRTLQGLRREPSKKRSQAQQREKHLSDPALVLAIFPGNPFVVVTNHRNPGNVHSAWKNPFLAGSPGAVKHFARPE
jgi:hypothetical protein